MPNTSRLTIPYPASTDIPDGAAQMQALAARVDAVCAMYAQGTLATRPAAGTQGRLYTTTDTGEVFMDTGTQWLALVPATSGRLADVGDLKFSARKSEHGGWIFSDGRALAAGQYANLRAMLVADGNPFGLSGTDPLLPDLRGRAPVGSGSGAGLTVRAIGQKGGAETHVLTVAQMPAHSHQRGIQPGGSQNDAAGNAGFMWHDQPSAIYNTTAEGGNGAHPNMQPYLVAQWFVYAGS